MKQLSQALRDRLLSNQHAFSDIVILQMHKDNYRMDALPETRLWAFWWLLKFWYQNTRQNNWFFIYHCETLNENDEIWAYVSHMQNILSTNKECLNPLVGVSAIGHSKDIGINSRRIILQVATNKTPSSTY